MFAIAHPDDVHWNRGSMMRNAIVDDLRSAIRHLSSRPLFTLTVVLTLALGIGANSAIFSVIKTVVLEALPYKDPHQLVALAQGGAQDQFGSVNVGYQTYLDWRAELPAFADIAVYADWQPAIAGAGEAKVLGGMSVTANLFALLGIHPVAGRMFTAAEDQPGYNDVVLISHRLWEQRFAADSAAIGKSVLLNGRSYTIVGVMPRGFQWLFKSGPAGLPEIWRPLGYDASVPYGCRSCMHLRAIARLQTGSTLEQARAQLDTLAGRLIAGHAEEYAQDMRFSAQPLREALIGATSRTLWMTFVAVSLVLLIACADVGNLLLVRSQARRHELTVRAALGANRRRLLHLLISESLLLGLMGGLLGVALAIIATRLLTHFGPSSIPRLGETEVDLTVLSFALAAGVLSALMAALIPALRASHPAPGEALKHGSKMSTGRKQHRLQGGLVIAQIALAFILGTGAILLTRSFSELLTVDPGFRTENAVAAKLAIVGQSYADPEQTVRFLDQLEQNMAAIAGVAAVGAVTPLPLGKDYDRASLHVKDRQIPEPQAPMFDRFYATPGYFEALGIPLQSGRYFSTEDSRTGPPVAIVSSALASSLWPDQSPIGKQIQLGARDDSAPWATIIGVVGDVRLHGLDIPPEPQAYLLHGQQADPANFLTLVVRSTLGLELTAAKLRQAALALDPAVPLYDVVPMANYLSEARARQTFLLMLYGFFAAIALLLAAIGIYGVVDHNVQTRLHALSIRRALGANSRQMLREITTRSLYYLAIGLGIGIPVALIWSEMLASELYGIAPHDLASFSWVIFGLIAVVAGATFAPARRALRADPNLLLREA